MKKIIIWAALILFLGSCGKKPEEKAEMIRPVKTVLVMSASDQLSKGFPSITQETREVELSFRISGPLVQLNAEIGQEITKGHLIAEVDPRDFKIDLAAKEGRMNQSKAEEQRYNNLYKKGSVSKNEHDIKLAAYLEAKSAYDDAVNALKDTKIYAPFNGYIGEKLVENYQEIQASQTIVTTLDISKLEVITYIPENLAIFFPKFSGYKVTFDAYPGKSFSATLKELGKSPEPAGFSLTLFLDHKIEKGMEYLIGPGFTCRVAIILEGEIDETSFIVPLSSVFETDTDTGPSVWVVDEENNIVTKRSVKIGSIISNNAIEILSGVNQGEIIVMAGAHRLVEGQKVKQLLDRL